jgi:GTP-binding protein
MVVKADASVGIDEDLAMWLDVHEGRCRECKLMPAKEAEEKAPFLRFVPFIFTSAKSGQRVHGVLDLLMQVDSERAKRVPTARVNEVLRELVGRRQPPQAAGREIKMLYATQAESSPPAITVFCSEPDLVQEHYVRYLHNGFREAWSFLGNPLRIKLRGRSA